MSYFVFNGRSSEDFGIRIHNELEFSTPARDLEKVTVLGRNAELLIDNRRYKTIQKSIKIDIRIPQGNGQELQNRVMQIYDWLNVQEWTDFRWSMYPDFTYRARVLNPFSILDALRWLGRGVIDMEFYPIMYYPNNELKTINSGATIANIGNVNAEPLIVITPATDSRIDILNNGEAWISLKDVTSKITIDSELMVATDADGNANKKMLIRKPLFPVLTQGDNKITFNNINKFEINPRIGRLAI